MINQHRSRFRWWLGAVRQQAITWANVDEDLCHHKASLGHYELTNHSPVMPDDYWYGRSGSKLLLGDGLVPLGAASHCLNKYGIISEPNNCDKNVPVLIKLFMNTWSGLHQRNWNSTQIARFMGLTWAPCWPNEPCYLGSVEHLPVVVTSGHKCSAHTCKAKTGHSRATIVFFKWIIHGSGCTLP